MRSILVAVLAATLLLAPSGCGSAVDDPVVNARDQALMDRAIAKARETHPQLIQALQSPRPDWSGFAIKKPYPTPDGGEEHMWIDEVTWDGSAFHGIVNNDAVNTTAVKLGDRVTVSPDELSDWMYLDGRRVVGGYTLRVLHYESSPQQQQEFIAGTGLEVPPIDF